MLSIIIITTSFYLLNIAIGNVEHSLSSQQNVLKVLTYSFLCFKNFNRTMAPLRKIKETWHTIIESTHEKLALSISGLRERSQMT